MGVFDKYTAVLEDLDPIKFTGVVQRVQGLLSWEVRTTTHTRKLRAYGDRPARVVREQEHRLEVCRCEAAIAQATNAITPGDAHGFITHCGYSDTIE